MVCVNLTTARSILLLPDCHATRIPPTQYLVLYYRHSIYTANHTYFCCSDEALNDLRRFIFWLFYNFESNITHERMRVAKKSILSSEIHILFSYYVSLWMFQNGSILKDIANYASLTLVKRHIQIRHKIECNSIYRISNDRLCFYIIMT